MPRRPRIGLSAAGAHAVGIAVASALLAFAMPAFATDPVDSTQERTGGSGDTEHGGKDHAEDDGKHDGNSDDGGDGKDGGGDDTGALADLEIDKSVDDDAPLVGDEIAFTVRVDNRGPARAKDITVADALESGFAYVAHSGDGAYDPASGVWTVGRLPADGTATLTIRVVVERGGNYRNVAEVTHSSQADPDSVPADGRGDDYDELVVVPRDSDPGPDTDDDGVPDSDDLDDDNDGLPDVIEGDRSTDQDGDGAPDSLDTDADGDGVPDTVEAGASDDDGDGEIDGFVDDNGDGLDDRVAADPLPRPDSDGDGATDDLDIDADDDGLLDSTEAGATPHRPVDSDADGRPDYVDVDADNDGIVDLEEGQPENAYVPPSGSDADGDGLDDAYDADPSSTDPSASRGVAPVDTDGTGTPDYLDLDTDDDTVPDTTEGHDANLDGRPDQVALGSDADGDGLDDAFDLVDGPSPTPDSSVAPRQDADEDGVRDWRDADDDDNPIPSLADGVLSGTTWLDADTDSLLDSTEMLLAGWTVELLLGGEVLASVPADANGNYLFEDLAAATYTLRTRHPASGAVFAQRDSIELAADAAAASAARKPSTSAPSTAVAESVETLLDQHLPVQPTGVVYDADARVPVPDAAVTVQDSLGRALPALCLRPGQQGQRVASDGFFRIDVELDADPACRTDATYTLAVDAPAGFVDAPSTLLPPLPSLDPTGSSNPLRVQPQQSAPQPGDTTDYHLSFVLEAGDPDVLNNHVPLDAAGAVSVTLGKRADRTEVAVGEIVRYTVRIENAGSSDLVGFTLTDTLPPGFALVEESLRLDGATTGFDVQSTRPLVLTGIAVPAGTTATLTYALRVGAGVTQGRYRNTIVGALGGTPLGDQAAASVDVVGNPEFEQTTIIGNVFADTNGNGYRDPSESGIAAARLATVTGLLIETDAFGRFHIAGEDVPNLERGRNFYLKLDADSLPPGSRVTTENPRVRRVTQGTLGRFDFGVVLPEVEARTDRIADLEDVSEVLFEPGELRLTPAGIAALDGVAARLADFDCGTLAVEGVAGTCPIAVGEPAEYALTTTFPVLSDALSDADRGALDEIAARWRNRDVLRVTVVGHASSEPIKPENRGLFADNYVLSLARARSVARYLSGALNVPANRIEVEGRGPDEPVASNATEAGRARNRRAEIQIYEAAYEACENPGYDGAALAAARGRVIVDHLVGALGEGRFCRVAPGIPADDACEDCGGFLVTAASRVDEARPDTSPIARTGIVDAAVGMRDAASGRVWVREDPAVLERRLAVAVPSVVRLGEDAPVVFTTHTNYPAFIDRLELVLYARDDADRVEPLARLDVPVAAYSQAAWPVDDTLAAGLELVAVLRAHGIDGGVDEAAPIGLRLVDAGFTGRIEPDDALAALADRPPPRAQNILIDGSRVRVHGEDIAAGARVTIAGAPVPVDVDGRFAVEYLVPVGEHAFDVTVTEGRTSTVHPLPVAVDGKYMFLAALADFTASSSDLDGAVEPVSGDPEFADESLVEGRLALYLKGKIKGRYLITAQADTGEEEVGEMLDRLDEKDPRALFRYLDPDRYYPVYGDDSTTIDDTDSLGKFYVRVDWDRSKALWGNYHTGLTGTELAQYNRSLYGAKLDYQSRALNDAVETPRARGIAFASEAETALAHDEFLGTGGSLYYLRNSDVVLGSEKVHVEIRERDSGRVLENVALVRGADYEIDPLQGRVLLARPLNQFTFAAAPAIVRDRPLDGDDTVLLVDYEYRPTGFDADNMTAGGRGRYWLTEKLEIGATYVDESRDATDYELGGVDLTFRAGEGTYLKIETAETESSQTNVFFSDNGGLSFASTNRIDPVTGNEIAGPRSGRAWSLEGRLNLREQGLTERNWTGAFWRRETDAGFSVARRDLGVETVETGFEIAGEIGRALELSVRASSVELTDTLESDKLSLQIEQTEGRGRLAGELRVVDERDPTAGTDNDATLAALKYTHAINAALDLYGIVQTTVDDDGGAYADNDLLGIGARARVADRMSVQAEHNEGDRGEATLVGIDYQVTPDRQIYGTYTLSADRSDTLPYREQFAVGQRSAIGNQANLFTETQFVDVDTASGIAHAFGLDFGVDTAWGFGISAQQGELEALSGLVDRDALGLSGSFEGGKWRWRSSIEMRSDDGAEQRDQLVTSHRVDRVFSDAFRFLVRINAADTDDLLEPLEDARFVEGSIGLAYRPTDGGRLDYLAKYTVLHDLPGLAQARTDSAQRSEIVSFEGVYRLNPRWDLGGKVASRTAEVRDTRTDGPWYESDADLVVLRGTYHLFSRWDALAEFRKLSVGDGGGERKGFLLGLDRHVNDHMKVGIGYNFTDFSDDLGDLDYDKRGWFLNVVGKY